MTAHLKRDTVRCILLLAALGCSAILSPGPASADKSSVTIDAPAAVTQGDAITIRVTVHHDANNLLHYTNWLYILVNGREIARWDYSWRKRPEGETFTREVTYTVTGPVEIKSEANCNLHGSAGPQTLTVPLKDK